MTTINSTFIITTKEKQSKKIKGNNRTIVIRASLSRLLKNLAFTLSKPIFITYKTPLYNTTCNTPKKKQKKKRLKGRVFK